MNRWLAASLAVALMTGAGVLDAGGWAVITVGQLPDSVVAGQPVAVEFAVRQHGQHLVPNLAGRVVARSGADSLEAAAAAGGRPGYYVASVTLPRPGSWTITIVSGFVTSKVTLAPVTAIAAGKPAPPALPPAIVGKRLFTAKGCATCHSYDRADRVETSTTAYGPSLTNRVYARPYLERILADPSVLPRWTSSPFPMPNLGLSEREIAALAAFMTTSTIGTH